VSAGFEKSGWSRSSVALVLWPRGFKKQLADLVIAATGDPS
jgi:hypothetical protein